MTSTRLFLLASLLFVSSAACDDDPTESTDAATDVNTQSDTAIDMAPGDTAGDTRPGDAGASG